MKIFLYVIVIVIIYIVWTYKTFIKKTEDIKQAASSIDVYLTQKFNLLPDLAECVKEYMKHEQPTFLEAKRKSEEYMKYRNLKEGKKLSNECNRILKLADNYPELQISKPYVEIQKKLMTMENHLNSAISIYNTEVNSYNNKVKKFPTSIIAVIFGFDEEEALETKEETDEN